MSQCRLSVEKRLDLYSSQLSKKLEHIEVNTIFVSELVGGVTGSLITFPLACSLAGLTLPIFSNIIYESDYWKNHDNDYKFLYSVAVGFELPFMATLNLGTGVGVAFGGCVGRGATPLIGLLSILYDASYFVVDQSISLMGFQNSDYCVN